MVRSNIRDENTNVPSVFRLRHENSQMPCKALLCMGPVKLGDVVHSSLPLRFSGENPHSLWMFHILISEQLDRQTNQDHTLPTDQLSEGFAGVHIRRLLCVPAFQRRCPLSRRVYPCFLCSLRAESVSHSFLCCHSPALFLTHGKILN